MNGLDAALSLLASLVLAAGVGWVSIRTHTAWAGRQALGTYRLVLVHLISLSTPLVAIVEVMRYAAQELCMVKFEDPVTLWEVAFLPLWVVGVLGVVLWIVSREIRHKR